MKKSVFPAILAMALLSVTFFCSCTDESEGGGTKKYSFWRGDIPNKFYKYDICGFASGEISGKPYMVLEYNTVTGEPARCEFGLSEVDFKRLPISEPTICIGSPPRPTMYASTFDYAERLELKGTVDLLSNWYPVTNLSTLSGGGVDFNVQIGKFKLHFVRNNMSMVGEIVDEGQDGWGDMISDEKAFNMLHKFDSNTIGN